MELSAAGMNLASVDPYKADQDQDYRFSDILRKRQRPLLLIIDENGQLIYSSLPDDIADKPENARVITPELLDEVLVEARRLLQTEDQPVSSVLERLIIDKPGERCALVTLEKQFCCLRLFSLEGRGPGNQQLYGVLLELIGDPETGGIDLDKVKEIFRLSNREADVVEALLTGGTDKEIARTLGVSVETIRAYLKSVRAKLGVSTRTAIVSLVHGMRNDKLPTNS